MSQTTAELECLDELRKLVTVLKRRDAEGRAIIICRYDNLDSGGVEDVFVAGTLLTEEIWNKESVERNGFVLITDHAHFEPRHLTMWTPSAIIKLVRLFSENYPLRHSDVFVVNASKLTKWAVKLFSLFLPHKIKSRLSVLTKEEMGVLRKRLENVWDFDSEMRIQRKSQYYDKLREALRRIRHS